MTTTRMFVVGVLAAALATTGCKSKSKGADKKDGNNAAAPMSDDLRGVLAMMPLDSEMVAGIDFAALRKTKIYADHAGQLKGLAASQLDVVQDLCGFDVTEEIGSVVFAGKGKSKNGDMTALVRGLPKAKVLDCLTKGQATPPDGFVISVDGDYALVEITEKKEATDDPAAANRRPGPPPEPADAGAGAGSGTAIATTDDAGAPIVMGKKNQSLSLKFLDATTVIVARRKGHATTGAELDAIVAGKSGKTIVSSDGFMQLIDGTDTDAPIWGVVNGTAPLFKAIAKYVPFAAAFGSVRVGDDLDIDVTARMINDQAAKDFSSLLIHLFDNLKKSTLRDAIGPNDVTKTDADVHVTLHESGPQLTKLASSGKELMMALLAGIFGQ